MNNFQDKVSFIWQVADLLRGPYRVDNRFTQEDTAKGIGVTFFTVFRWLNSKTTPNIFQQYHIEMFLKGKSGGKEKI